MEKKENNAQWLRDEFQEWIDSALLEVTKLKNTATKTEYDRLSEKESTLRMVKNKFEDLRYR